ncbi:hypothetical protein SpCBS45565_g06113 [Spizellomyces sp. 'palustris']|nr:hypothetical protein SpCBS45565_g06113 [Spizellomyces sp. 'palustris']
MFCPLTYSLHCKVLGEIAQAVNTIYDPSATNTQRQLAQNFCETLKDNPQSPLWGHYLAHKQNSQPDILRHFGLSLIENAVRFKWNDGSYSDQDRAELRDAVVDLVTNGTHEIFVERTYIKEKVSRLFVEVAKRMWPIQWPHMDILLRELYAQNPTTRELCLLIYRSLAEDVFLYEDVVAELRKQELVTGMMAVTVSAHILEDLHAKRGADVNLRSEGTQQATESGRTDFEMLLRLIRANPENEGWLNRWVGGAADLHQEWVVQRTGNAERAPVTERLAVLTLNTLVVYLDWVLLRYQQRIFISRCESRVAYLLTDLLLSASLPIRQSAAECLVVLFSRNIHYADTENRLSCIWTPIFAEGNLEKMITAWARVHGQTDAGGIDSVEQTSLVEEEDYKFMKRLAQGATALGENQICFKKAAERPPNFTRYLEFMMVIFDHPSILVASTTASLWGELVKHDYFISTQEILFSLPQLLTLIATRVCQDHTHEDAVTHYRYIDFDSADEFETFSGAFRQRMLDIVRSIANLKPKDSFSYVVERVRQMLVLQPNSAFTNDVGFQKDDSPYVQLFEGNCALLEIIVAGSLKSSEGLDESFWRFMMDLVEFILNFKTADPTLARIQLQMIVAFGGVLHLAPPLLLQCLEKIFTFVAFTMPGEEDFIRRKISICEATRVLRRKAASLLVKLAMTMPDALIGIYASISPAIQRLSDERLVLMSEETILKEFLLSIVYVDRYRFAKTCTVTEDKINIRYFSSTPLVEKAPAFTSLVEPTVRALEDKADVDLTSPSQIMEFMGAPLLASNVQNVQMSPGQLQVANPGLVDAFAIKKEQRGQLLGLLAAMSQYLKLTIEIKPLNNFGYDKSVGGNKRVELWADYIPRILRSVLTIIKSIHGLWVPRVWQQFPSDVLRVLATTPQERALFAGTDVSDDLLAVGANEFMNQVTMMSRWLGSIRDQW